MRRVIADLAIEHGSTAALAWARATTTAALGKGKLPSRAQSSRLAFMVARVAGVGVDDVLAGRWQRCTCQACGARAGRWLWGNAWVRWRARTAGRP